MRKCLCALDLGNLCGFFVLPEDGDPVFGTLDLQPNRFDGSGMRFVRFQCELDRLHLQHQITLIVFEEVRRFMSAQAATAYGGYMAVLMAWGETRKVPVTSVPVGTWKKALCGQGNASKPLIKQCIQRLGFNVQTYDAADAAGIALWAEKEFVY